MKPKRIKIGQHWMWTYTNNRKEIWEVTSTLAGLCNLQEIYGDKNVITNYAFEYLNQVRWKYLGLKPNLKIVSILYGS